MARQLSKENLKLVLMQAMMTAKNVRTQCDRLLELHRRLHRHQAAPVPAPADAKLRELASDVFKVYYFGLDAGAKMLSGCLKIAVENLPRCVECLVGGWAPVRGKPDSSPDRDDDPDPVAAATKAGLSDDPAASATAKDRPCRAASGGDVDKALDYLCRADRITSLAIKHIDLAVAVLSRFVDPKELARLAELTDDFAYLGSESRLASPLLGLMRQQISQLIGALQLIY